MLIWISSLSRDGEPSAWHHRCLIILGERGRVTLRGTVLAARPGSSLSHQRRHRNCRRHGADVDHYKCSARVIGRFTCATCKCNWPQTRTSRRTPSRRAGSGCATRSMPSSRARAANAPSTVCIWRAGQQHRQSHLHRSRLAALRQPRTVQGHPRRQVARRLQRQDLRPPGRPEDRRQADQQDAAAVRRCDHQHEAAAGNLRRRRQMHARRDGRAARCRIDLLSASRGVGSG